jgi:hypothetical protein
MNKRFSLVLLLAIAWLPLFAQLDSFPTQKSLRLQPSAYVMAETELGIGSNFLNKELIFNDFWSSDLIATQIDQLSSTNRFGAYNNSRVLYVTALDSSVKWRKSFGFSYVSLNGLTASDAFVKTILQGNQPNRRIDFDPVHGYELWNTVSLDFGFSDYDKIKKRNQSITLSLVGGLNYQNLNAQGGYLETDSSGGMITLSETDISLSENTGGNSGIGFTLSYSLTKKLNSTSILQFNADNLGFVRYDVTTYNLVSSTSFEGFDVTTPIRTGEEINLQDSVENQFITEESGARIIPFPARLALGYERTLSYRNALEASVSYLYFPGYLPQVEGLYLQRIGESNALWKIGARVGGFGSYALRLGLELPIGSTSGLQLDIAGAESMATSNLPVNWFGKFGLVVGL